MHPISSQYIIVSSLLKAPHLTLFDYKYPDWSITVGYMIGLSSFMWIPIYMVYKLVWTPGSLKQVSGWRRKCAKCCSDTFSFNLTLTNFCLVFHRGWQFVSDQRGPYQTSTLTTSTWLLCHRKNNTRKKTACSFYSNHSFRLLFVTELEHLTSRLLPADDVQHVIFHCKCTLCKMVNAAKFVI